LCRREESDGALDRVPDSLQDLLLVAPPEVVVVNLDAIATRAILGILGPGVSQSGATNGGLAVLGRTLQGPEDVGAG